MPFVPLKLPPGISRPGTRYDARGRWFDSNLVRWYEGAMRPIGGWDPLRSTDPGGPISVGEPIRGMHAWRANDESVHLVFGSHGRLWHFSVREAGDEELPGLVINPAVTSDVASS
jgi:hypothetical protein